jgi:hypothetical protein
MLVLIIHFFATIYFTTPMVQSMWNMLVFPYYKTPLQTGVVYFTIIITGLLKISLVKKEDDSSNIVIKIVGFYLAVGITWCLAVGYSYFM